MDQELNLNEWLQQRLSRRDLFRATGVAGLSLFALLDLPRLFRHFSPRPRRPLVPHQRSAGS